jgi:hypothetical protein
MELLKLKITGLGNLPSEKPENCTVYFIENGELIQTI